MLPLQCFVSRILFMILFHSQYKPMKLMRFCSNLFEYSYPRPVYKNNQIYRFLKTCSPECAEQNFKTTLLSDTRIEKLFHRNRIPPRQLFMWKDPNLGFYFLSSRLCFVQGSGSNPERAIQKLFILVFLLRLFR